MTRGGRAKDRDAGAMRTCIATGAERPRTELIRFVIGPDDTVVPDILGRLPGRGIHVAPERAALERAVKKRQFARVARRPVTVPEDLVDAVESQLARRVVELISLARKAGMAVAGYEKVKAWLGRGEAKVLLQACDGSTRGKSRLSTPEGGRWIGWLTSDELGLAFGRQTVIHGALGAGGLTSRVVEEAAKLQGLRTDEQSRGGARARPAGKDKTAR
ncbi:RNA-binding protein [Rhodosalinus sp.]|uniref:RNA-binding protein n=1 Tax=Rhodosalinus sp. TaxID=2047741 RepID=UPI0035638201